MTTLGIAKEHAPVGCNTVVDNRPSLLGERVCLDASVDQVDRLSRANERAVGLSLDELLVDLEGRKQLFVCSVVDKSTGPVRVWNGKSLLVVTSFPKGTSATR